MINFFKGHTFKVCSLDELINSGWSKGLHRGKRYSHKDFARYVLPPDEIMRKLEGKTLTVDKKSTFAQNCYWVKDNIWEWPVAAFEDIAGNLVVTKNIKTIHVCIEGMTPIDGWYICKHCGMDLRRINEKSWKLGKTVWLRLTF